VGLACFYQEVRPDVVINRNDEALATFVVHELPRNVGLVGLLLAAIFAAAMSTLSSSLNSSAVVHDFLKSRGDGQRHERRLLNWSRGLTVVFGVIQIAIALLAVRVSRSVVGEALAIVGFSAGLLLGLFLLGVCTRRVNQRAALVGLMLGLTGLLFVKFAPSLFINFVLPQVDKFAPPLVVDLMKTAFDWNVAWPWLPVIGCGITFGGGLLASYLVPSKRKSLGDEISATQVKG